MALHITLTPSRASYRPGDLITAEVQVANLQAAALRLVGLVLELNCVERVDPSWVSGAWSAQEGTQLPREGRRMARQLLQATTSVEPACPSLAPSSSRSYVFRVQLPDSLPPSFKGTAVRYSYILKARARTTADAAAEEAGAPPSTLGAASDEQVQQVHLKVWPKAEAMDRRAPGLAVGEDAAPPLSQYAATCLSTAAELLPACEEGQQGAEMLGVRGMTSPVRDSAMPSHGNGTPLTPMHQLSVAEESLRVHANGSETPSELRRASLPDGFPEGGAALKSYNLRMGDFPIGRVSLHPAVGGTIQPGSTLAGSIDLRASHEAASRQAEAPRCVALVLSLETEECVREPWRHPRRPASETVREVVEEYQQLTPDTLMTHFLFTLPLSCPISFATPLVALRWVLRFEFTLQSRAAGGTWGLGSGGPPPQQMTWLLPLLVRPPGL